jgi:hypothetical protein
MKHHFFNNCTGIWRKLINLQQTVWTRELETYIEAQINLRIHLVNDGKDNLLVDSHNILVEELLLKAIECI